MVAPDFLQDCKMFFLLMASMESFFRTLGLLFSSLSEMGSVRVLPLDLGEFGGDTLLCDSEDLPELTAESLSESSDLTTGELFLGEELELGDSLLPS